MSLEVVILVVAIALGFDFMNGFHDAANSIATVVSTQVLSPKAGVMWAAFFNFVAAFGFGVAVASTMGEGIINTNIVTEWLILCTLVGAIAWDVITWWLGLPISSSHALVGGLVGTALVAGGWVAIHMEGLLVIVLFIVLSPLIGFLVALALIMVTSRIARKFPRPMTNRAFRRLQLISAALYSLGHGSNDAQKTMGIIAVLLFTEGLLGPVFFVPFYVVLMAHAAIALGTYLGGWRIVRTMGTRITKLTPFGGFNAETAAASALFLTAHFGIPVSTTHTIAGAIIGVGATRRLSAVRWGIARRIVWAWVLTIPVSASISAVIYILLRSVFLLA
jgi:PiT family inorganic phosphate transporter